MNYYILKILKKPINSFFSNITKKILEKLLFFEVYLVGKRTIKIHLRSDGKVAYARGCKVR